MRKYCADPRAIQSRLVKWYAENECTTEQVWAVNGIGNLLRGGWHMKMRRKLVDDMCVNVDDDQRISPAKIASHAGVCRTTVLTIANGLWRARALEIV